MYFFIFFFLSIYWASDCHRGVETFGPPNNNSVSDGASHSQLVGKVKNGKRYTVTVENGGGAEVSNFTLLHVYGTPYEMGYAQGELMKDRARTFIKTVWEYMESQVDTAIVPYVPAWLAPWIADLGLDAALDLTYEATRDYSGDWFYEEMRGIADASGADYWTLVKISMIAGLTQGSCSAFGAWGEATHDGRLIQLRALDWNMDPVFIDMAQLTVYHPAPGHGHRFISLSFTGFVGALTGVNDQKLGISEIGISFPDDTFGTESRIGVPFVFLLRDILQWDSTLDQAVDRMANAKRTCDLFLGVGDGKLGQFRGFQYSSSVLRELAPQNDAPNNDTWHPKIPNVVYLGMDWICKGYNKVLATQLQKNYGSITPQVGIRDITAVEESGDTHIAYYDLQDMMFYMSVAAPPSVKVKNHAGYANQFTVFNATALFEEVL